MAQNIFWFISILIMGAACFYSGYSTGRSYEAARYEKYYREICSRLLEAFKRNEKD